ncbi:hypothetical protein OAL88_00255 [bacterium]|nr:hypothetical protein [bacterium]
MEEPWRHIFRNKNQNILVELLVHDFFSALKFLFDQGELSKLVYEEQLREVQSVRGKDLTVACKLLSKRFLRISSERPANLRIHLQQFFFEQKDSRKDPGNLSKTEAHSLRLRTTDPIFTLLKEARNVDAHNLSSHSTEWSILVLSSVQYLLTISQVNRQYLEDARLLSEFIRDALSHAFQERQVEDDSQIAVQEKDINPTVELLDELRQIKGILEVGGYEAANVSVASAGPSLSEAEFESALVKLRANVLELYAGDDWPGPMANLFQRSFVAEVLQYKPRNLAEAIRLPDVAWRLAQNRDLIKKQILRFGPEFDALISSVKWEEDDVF